MAPNPQALEDGLVAAVRELFSGPDREQLSVNTVRRRVEDRFGLEEGFFAGAEWKAKSKSVIKDAVVRARAFTSFTLEFLRSPLGGAVPVDILQQC